MTEQEFFDEPPYKFLLRQLHDHRDKERSWEKVRIILATQYNASGKAKRKVKPKDLISLDIDGRIKRYYRDEKLIEQACAAWQPIKAEA